MKRSLKITHKSAKKCFCVYKWQIGVTVSLSRDDVLGDVLRSDDNNKNGDLTNFKDGSNYKNNELYAVHPNALQIVLYHDDFTQSNPLGNKTSKFKISGFYYLLGKLKIIGYQKILGPCINYIQKLKV